MQLVGSPDKGWNVFGHQLTPQGSKLCTETIFKQLTTSQPFIDSLMTTDSQGRMDFLAHKISEAIKVKVASTKTRIASLLLPKTPFLFAKTLMVFFRMRTTDQGSATDSPRM